MDSIKISQADWDALDALFDEHSGAGFDFASLDSDGNHPSIQLTNAGEMMQDGQYDLDATFLLDNEASCEPDSDKDKGLVPLKPIAAIEPEGQPGGSGAAIVQDGSVESQAPRLPDDISELWAEINQLKEE